MQVCTITFPIEYVLLNKLMLYKHNHLFFSKMTHYIVTQVTNITQCNMIFAMPRVTAHDISGMPFPATEITLPRNDYA